MSDRIIAGRDTGYKIFFLGTILILLPMIIGAIFPDHVSQNIIYLRVLGYGGAVFFLGATVIVVFQDLHKINAKSILVMIFLSSCGAVVFFLSFSVTPAGNFHLFRIF